jgi:hypothetical protein
MIDPFAKFIRSLPKRYRPIPAIIGGLLINLTIGSTYSFGREVIFDKILNFIDSFE